MMGEISRFDVELPWASPTEIYIQPKLALQDRLPDAWVAIGVFRGDMLHTISLELKPLEIRTNARTN